MKLLNLMEPQATLPLNWPVVVAADIAEKQPFSKLTVVLYLERVNIYLCTIVCFAQLVIPLSR